ncbi:MAG: bifunctional diguanylate cyclase/phosphodiesterase [Thiolinea sp.]
MKPFFFYPKSLKNKVILVLCIFFLLVWSGFSLFLYHKAESDLIASLSRSLDHINNELTLMIESEVRSMTSIVRNIAEINFRHNGDMLSPPTKEDMTLTADIYRDVRQSWAMLEDVRRTRFLQYYDSKGELVSEWGSSLGDIPDDTAIAAAYEKTYASSWFGCKDVCFLNVLDKAGADSFAEGSLRVGLLVDDIIHNFNELNTIKVTFFKGQQLSPNDAVFFEIAGNGYSLEAASSYDFFEKVRSSLSGFDFKKTYIFSDGNQYYSIQLIDKYKHDDFYYALSMDVTDEYSEVWSKYNYAVWGSMILLALSLLMTYLILAKMTINFEKLAQLMELIGKGAFAETEKNIPEKYLNNNDEIGLIYQATKRLSRQLSDMKQQLLDDIDHHISLEKKVRHAAEHDQLTQLMNRKKFNDTAIDLLGRIDRAAYVAMDLDYFKLVNDSMGHQAGDQLLVDIANILTRHSKHYGAIVGRLGGDEFAMLVPAGEKSVILELFSAVLRDISDIKSEARYFTVSMSSGVAFYPSDAQSLEELGLLADTAMYENKRLKNKKINFYTGTEKILSLKMEQKYYASLIKKVVDENMISLYFQPIVGLKDRKTIGIEILVRVFDQQSDSSMPTGKLISYAEKTGRVIDIDLQVLSKILDCARGKNIQHALMINISNLSISNADISEEIFRIIRDSGFPFSKIVFEIIESSEIENLDATVRFIQRFKRMGVRFALDDFGSGFFSFFYLKVLPVDFLKIDKSIILDAISDRKNHHIIKAITGLADDLGIKVIAEGVEDQQILDAISGYHISYIQGYHIATPQPVAQF